MLEDFEKKMQKYQIVFDTLRSQYDKNIAFLEQARGYKEVFTKYIDYANRQKYLFSIELSESLKDAVSVHNKNLFSGT